MDGEQVHEETGNENSGVGNEQAVQAEAFSQSDPLHGQTDRQLNDLRVIQEVEPLMGLEEGHEDAANKKCADQGALARQQNLEHVPRFIGHFEDCGEPENDRYIQALHEFHSTAIIRGVTRGVKPIETGSCA